MFVFLILSNDFTFHDSGPDTSFDKITIDFWRSRKRSHISDLLKARSSKVRPTFLGDSVSIKYVTLRVRTALFDKMTTGFWRSRLRLYDSDLPEAKKHKIGPKIEPKIKKCNFYIVFARFCWVLLN